MRLIDWILSRDKKPQVQLRSIAALRSDGASMSRRDLRPVPRVVPLAVPPAAVPRTYEVRYGDSRSRIAKRLYGDRDQWRKIFEANRDQIKHPDRIYPGQKLVIP